MPLFDPEYLNHMTAQFKRMSEIAARWQETMGESPFGEDAIGEPCESSTDDDSFWEY